VEQTYCGFSHLASISTSIFHVKLPFKEELKPVCLIVCALKKSNGADLQSEHVALALPLKKPGNLTPVGKTQKKQDCFRLYNSCKKSIAL